MWRALSIGAASIVVVGTVLVLPALLDAYKLAEGQFDPLIERSGWAPPATDGGLHAPDVPQISPPGGGASTREGTNLKSSPVSRAEPRLGASIEPGVMKDISLLRRFDAERDLNAALVADLASAREQIAHGFHARLSAVVSNREDDAIIAERLRRAADRGTSSDVPMSMTVRLGGEKIPASNVDGPTRSIAPETPPPGGPEEGQTRRASADGGTVLLPSSRGGPISLAGLPDRQQVRVVVRCARGARQRAKAIGESLRARGLDVAEPVDVHVTVDDGRVTYWYRADLADAERIASLASFPAPVRGRLPLQGGLPRPGTVEIAIGN